MYYTFIECSLNIQAMKFVGEHGLPGDRRRLPGYIQEGSARSRSRCSLARTPLFTACKRSTTSCRNEARVIRIRLLTPRVTKLTSTSSRRTSRPRWLGSKPSLRAPAKASKTNKTGRHRRRMKTALGLLLAVSILPAQSTNDAHFAAAKSAAGDDFQNLLNFQCYGPGPGGQRTPARCGARSGSAGWTRRAGSRCWARRARTGGTSGSIHVVRRTGEGLRQPVFLRAV